MTLMIGAELRKLLRSPAVIAVTAMGLLFTLFVYRQTAFNVAHGGWQESLLAPEGAVTYTLAAVVGIGPLLTAVIGATCSGQEFTCRTWPVLLTQGARRRQVWLAKLLAMLAAVAAWMLVTVVAGYAASVAASGRAGWPHLGVLVAAQTGAAYFTLAFWALVAFAAATAGGGTAAGTAIGIGFPVVELFFLRGLPLRHWLPGWNQISLIHAAFGTGERGIVVFRSGPHPTTAQALVWLAVLAAAMLAVSYAAIRRTKPA